MDIQGSRQPSDVEQLKTRFEQVTDAFFEQTQRKLELSRALNDREAIVKEQIKIEVMKGAQAILEGCYREVISDTGD